MHTIIANHKLQLLQFCMQILHECQKSCVDKRLHVNYTALTSTMQALLCVSSTILKLFSYATRTRHALKNHSLLCHLVDHTPIMAWEGCPREDESFQITSFQQLAIKQNLIQKNCWVNIFISSELDIYCWRLHAAMGNEWVCFSPISHLSQVSGYDRPHSLLRWVVCIVMYHAESYITAREFSIELTSVLACSELLVMNLDSLLAKSCHAVICRVCN